jgi:UDP-N-acetylmuramate--alanine ligase
MSALARYFLAQGFVVGGYDKTKTVLTTKLEEEGALIHYVDAVVQIKECFLNKADTLIVRTPAVPVDHKEWLYFQKEEFDILKRSQILGKITEAHPSVAVSGTHGKTTISSMVAQMFKFCEVPFTAFLGGIAKDLGSNYYHDSDSEITVIEADEYDRSFLWLKPDIITVSAVDPDHLDIYGTKEEMERTFREFLSENLNDNGKSIVHHNLISILGDEHLTYSIDNADADFYGANFRVENAEFLADFKWDNQVLKNVKIGLPGIHNMENALVTFAVGIQKGIAPLKLKAALAAYTGVDRRFDIQIQTKDIVYIDDYAHHPEEILMLLKSVRKMYPERKILGVFQPHLFSRTQDFAEGFARSLELLDELLLLDIYPARELPIEGVNSDMLFKLINMKSKMVCSKKQLPTLIKQSNCNVILTIGAGDIGAEVTRIKDYLLN